MPSWLIAAGNDSLSKPLIGILALQGGFAAHQRVLNQLKTPSQWVKTIQDLDRCDGLILPGGESSTMLKLLHCFDLFEALRGFGNSGKPVLGTCAGAILMAETVIDPQQDCFGWLPATIQRNAYGSQRESFEAQFAVPPFHITDLRALFIRAPRFVEWQEGVTVLSEHKGIATGLSWNQFTAITYHPELTLDCRFHQGWLAQFH
jgi:5'-phosphate synthase pdxT subunit